MEDSITGNGGKEKKFTCSKLHWKPEEDVLLTTIVQRFGPNNWELIASNFRGRTGKSCRSRWVNQLDPKINKEPFSVEEKQRVLELHQCYGKKWSIISKHFRCRTDNQLKNQYHVLVGKRTSNASSSTLASRSQVSNISHNRENIGFDPCSDVIIPYRVEVPFIDSGPSVHWKDEMWYAASGSDPGMIGPHSFDNANLGYIGTNEDTIWYDAMNSDISYTELLDLPSVSPPQHGYVKDHNFIDFFGLEKL